MGTEGNGASRWATLGASLAIAAVAPGTAGAATVAPDTGLDSGAGNCTLREAIQTLNAGGNQDACTHTGDFGTDDTVTLVAGTIYDLSIAGDDEQNNATGDLDVFDDMAIVGDADNKPIIRNTVIDRVLDTPNDNTSLRLESLIVEDGQLTAAVEQHGANIRFRGDPSEILTLDDVTVRDGTGGAGADVQGGAISAQEGGHVEIENGSLIAGNRVGPGTSSFFTGGGIHIAGVGTDLTVTDSKISGNEAGVGNNVVIPTGGAGGGIHSEATGASAIVLTDSTIDGNRAGGGDSSTGTSGFGGGIALGSGSASSLQITGGEVTDNIAAGGFGAGQGRGGGVYAESTATGFSLDGVTVTGNKAGGEAGANAGDGIGGGIYSDRDLSVTGGSVSMNHAGNSGGATGSGGGIAISAPAGPSDLTLEDTTVNNNIAGVFLGAGGSGGGVQMIGAGTLTVTDSTVSNNNTYQGPGGGVYRESLTPTSGEDSISRSTIAGNSATGGGGIHIRDDNTPLAISQSTLSTNGATGGVADGGGGGIYTESDLTVSNSTVANNNATQPGGPMGGGIRTSSDPGDAPTLALDQVTMAGNATSGAGGHLFLEGGVGDASIRASILGLGSATGDPATSRCSQEVPGLIDSGGFNLELGTDQCGFDAAGDITSVSNTDAALGPLGPNGGPTQTIPLEFGSVAIDRVISGCPRRRRISAASRARRAPPAIRAPTSSQAAR